MDLWNAVRLYENKKNGLNNIYVSLKSDNVVRGGSSILRRRRRLPTKRERQHTNLSNFPKNSMESTKF